MNLLIFKFYDYNNFNASNFYNAEFMAHAVNLMIMFSNSHKSKIP
jgi:hypothetical protein